MRLLIISVFLAAAASLGMADGPSKKPTSPTLPTSLSYPSSPFPEPTLIPSSSGTPSKSTEHTDEPDPDDPDANKVIKPTEPDPDDPDANKVTKPTAHNSSGLQPFADALSSTAKNPISELLSLSAECQATLFGIITQPEFLKCVPVGAFLPLLPILIDPNGLKKLLADPVHSLPPVLEPLFGGLCAADKCSDNLISQALQALGKGCKKDAKNPLIQMVTGVTTFYSPIRDSICFKDNKKEFCVIETIKIVFTLPKPPVSITGTIIDNVAFAEPKSICTPCNKAIINTFFNYIDADKNKCVEFLTSINVPQQLLTIAKLGVALKCGFQFLDGKVGDPSKTDADDFEYQVSSSGASNVKGFSLVAMIGTLLVSALMI